LCRPVSVGLSVELSVVVVKFQVQSPTEFSVEDSVSVSVSLLVVKRKIVSVLVLKSQKVKITVLPVSYFLLRQKRRACTLYEYHFNVALYQIFRSPPPHWPETPFWNPRPSDVGCPRKPEKPNFDRIVDKIPFAFLAVKESHLCSPETCHICTKL
jgi:hypothetical protein